MAFCVRMQEINLLKTAWQSWRSREEVLVEGDTEQLSEKVCSLCFHRNTREMYFVIFNKPHWKKFFQFYFLLNTVKNQITFSFFISWIPEIWSIWAAKYWNLSPCWKWLRRKQFRCIKQPVGNCPLGTKKNSYLENVDNNIYTFSVVFMGVLLGTCFNFVSFSNHSFSLNSAEGLAGSESCYSF